MVFYHCLRCGYIASQKSNFIHHLDRKNKCEIVLDDVDTNYMKENLEKCKSLKKPSKLLKKNLIFPQKPSFLLKKNEFDCIFCGKVFSRNDNLKRHYKKCKQKIDDDSKIEQLELKLQQEEKDKQEIQTKLDNIVVELKNIKDKPTTTTYNKTEHITNNYTLQQNTVIINNYGEENLSFMTDKQLRKMTLNMPKGIYILAEKCHFSKEHPENKNVRITNKKDNMVQIWKDNKWMYREKTTVLSELVADKYAILDEKFSQMKEKGEVTEVHQKKMDTFRERLETNEKYNKLLNKNMEIVILNNS